MGGYLIAMPFPYWEYVALPLLPHLKFRDYPLNTVEEGQLKYKYWFLSVNQVAERPSDWRLFHCRQKGPHRDSISFCPHMHFNVPQNLAAIIG